jgi:ElaB/YqjD/DUF883 family membrane-anchored ribosome-binding protein
MNSETKAVYEALAENQGKSLRMASNFDDNKDKLLADLKLVAADAEKLIKEVAGASSEGFATLQGRFEAKLSDAKAQLGRARSAARDQAQHATVAAQAYVKANPWQSAGVLAVAAMILGFILGRQSAGSDVDVPIE